LFCLLRRFPKRTGNVIDQRTLFLSAFVAISYRTVKS
jgi:hypothetical protein